MNIFLKKYWLHVKKYWKVFALGIAFIVVAVIASSKTKMISEMLDTALKSFETEKKELEKLDKEEKQKKAKIQKTYDETVDAIEKKYAEQEKSLTKKKKKRVKELTERYSEEPELLDSFLEDEFGLTKV